MKAGFRIIVLSAVAVSAMAVSFFLHPSVAVLAQPPAPTDTPAVAQTAAPTSIPTPMPTHTPISVMLVTPPTTPTPLSPWPEEVEKAIKTLRALWQKFGWLTVLIVLLAGLIALSLTVGKELLGTWSKNIAVWLDDRLHDLAAKLRRGPDPAERALLKDLFGRYEHLKMSGFVREKVMTASLESIYVPLFTQGKESGRLPRGGELGGLLVRGEAGEPLPLSSLLPHHRCLTIVGDAGSGKTTFVCHVALTMARALRDRRPAFVRQRLDWKVDASLLPILLPLSGFGAYLRTLDEADKESPNAELLLGYMRHHFRQLRLPEGFFEAQFNRHSRCLVLLDGLDEVADFQDRVLISQTIALLADCYEGTRFIVTCRPEGYQGGAELGGDFHRADIDPLRWPEDIVPFVKNWNEAVFKASSHTAADNAEDFLRRLQGQEQVRKLADNPLLLTVMIIVHFNVGTLPERRADLYDSATLLLLSWDTRWRRVLAAPPPWLDDIQPPGKRLYLEDLAYHWQRQNTAEVRREDVEVFLARSFLARLGQGKEVEAADRSAVFVDWLIERSYLLRPLGNGLGFYRRAFQEYLAARRLAREPDPAAAALDVLAQKRDWWEETVLLAVDHLSACDPDRAAALLKALLDALDVDTSHYHLVQAGRALAGVAREHLSRQLEDEARSRLADAVEHATPAFAAPLRVQAGRALAALGDPRPGVCDLFPVWVEVPGGSFRMGTPPEEVERWKAWYRQEIEKGREIPPEGIAQEQLYEIYTAWLDAEAGVHEVDVPTFYIARYPVTIAQFAPFVHSEGGGYHDPAFWTEAGWGWRQGEGGGWGRPPERRSEPMYWRDSRFNCPNQPVVGVTWHEAVAYCRWLTEQWRMTNSKFQDAQGNAIAICNLQFEIRLPTEAEWEKAARGGEGNTWPWGNEWDEKRANTSEGRGEWTTAAVGLYPEGASPYGALDMAGNVWQWTSTRWGDDWQRPTYGYPYRADDGREDPQGTVSLPLRVIRGGGWLADRVSARCADRLRLDPGFWSIDGGFRVVVSPVF